MKSKIILALLINLAIVSAVYGNVGWVLPVVNVVLTTILLLAVIVLIAISFLPKKLEDMMDELHYILTYDKPFSVSLLNHFIWLVGGRNH